MMAAWGGWPVGSPQSVRRCLSVLVGLAWALLLLGCEQRAETATTVVKDDPAVLVMPFTDDAGVLNEAGSRIAECAFLQLEVNGPASLTTFEFRSIEFEAAKMTAFTACDHAVLTEDVRAAFEKLTAPTHTLTGIVNETDGQWLINVQLASPNGTETFSGQVGAGEDAEAGRLIGQWVGGVLFASDPGSLAPLAAPLFGAKLKGRQGSSWDAVLQARTSEEWRELLKSHTGRGMRRLCAEKLATLDADAARSLLFDGSEPGDDGEDRYLRARVAVARRDFAMGAQEFEAVARLRPGLGSAIHWLVFNGDDRAFSTAELRRLTELLVSARRPSPQNSLYNGAAAYGRSELYRGGDMSKLLQLNEEALGHYRAAMQAAGPMPVMAKDVMQIHNQAGRVEELDAIYAEVTAAYPDCEIPVNTMAFLCSPVWDGSIEASAGVFAEAIQRRPQNRRFARAAMAFHRRIADALNPGGATSGDRLKSYLNVSPTARAQYDAALEAILADCGYGYGAAALCAHNAFQQDFDALQDVVLDVPGTWQAPIAAFDSYQPEFVFYWVQEAYRRNGQWKELIEATAKADWYDFDVLGTRWNTGKAKESINGDDPEGRACRLGAAYLFVGRLEEGAALLRSRFDVMTPEWKWHTVAALAIAGSETEFVKQQLEMAKPGELEKDLAEIARLALELNEGSGATVPAEVNALRALHGSRGLRRELRQRAGLPPDEPAQPRR